MKPIKFCVNSGFFGRRRDRFTEYQPDRTLSEKFEMIRQIRGIEGVELKYPADFQDPALARRLLADTGLKCAAVNVDIKDAAHFRHGALSATSKEARQRSVTLLCEGMDLAADLGAGLVSTCPLADGYDYPFQIDHGAAWSRFIESVVTAASHRPDVQLALEFQPHEPHARIMLSNVGKLLHVCAEAGLPNIGANFDVGHSFAAGETPAESVALLASKGRLFYIHSNDNTGEGGDWDMISGTVHFWHWLELLHTLDRIGYDGWIGGDITPKHMPPDQAYDVNTRILERMVALLERMNPESIDRLIAEGNPARTMEHLSRHLLP
jgi:xylose isomerase